MELTDFNKSYVFTIKIELEDDNYLILREPTILEMKDFGNDEKKNMETLVKLLPTAIVEHSFTSNGTPAKNKDVADMLIKSTSKFLPIISTWMDSLPITEKKSKKSEM